MTDLTRLITSLKRRSAHAKEFGDSITFVKLKDIDALVEALETGNTENERMAREIISRNGEIEGLRRHITELEESHAQVIQSRDHYKRMSEEGLKQLAEPRTFIVKLPHQAGFDDPQTAYDAIEECKAAIAAAGVTGIMWEVE
ncbi:hypothetical protein [Klebsiella aerogenes]|uniref:hypothetical protein n=1 Tax=Klebsiella aerogenes TaxID=548 RepID=UPI0019D2F1DE|nr:hypothetical protein [Klebsiella aerogenes]